MKTKIVAVFFHLLTLFILIITLNLLLDFRLRENHFMDLNIYSDNGIGLLLGFIVFSLIMGAVSVSLLISKWANERKLELYLKSFLTTDIVLIIGIGLLIFL